MLLANGVVLPRDAVAAEFCAGNALWSLYLAAEFRPKKLYAIEFQPELAELTKKVCGAVWSIWCHRDCKDDVLNALSHVGGEWLDAVFVNPPAERGHPPRLRGHGTLAAPPLLRENVFLSLGKR